MNEYLILALQFIAVIFASLFYGMWNSAPRHTLIASSLLGMTGYIVYWFLLGTSEMLAFFLGTFTCCFLSEICARLLKTPATVLSFVAIIPLVPGIMLYNTMLAFAQNDMNGGLRLGVRTLAAAGCMALAITVASLIGKHIITPISLKMAKKHSDFDGKVKRS